MNKPSNPKERNLLKGAIRRVFSRSDLRRKVIDRTRIEHSDPERPRVTRWSWCEECGQVTPTYLIEVDHVSPVIKLDETLEDLTWTELIEERIWCDEDNLKNLCKPCHKDKSRIESKLRRTLKGKNKK